MTTNKLKLPMTSGEFMHRMLEAFPDAEMGQDADGQITIHTGLTIMHGTDSIIVEMKGGA
jgi:hypothetical protein